MAEIKEITNMNTAFVVNGKTTLVAVPYTGNMTIGRSHRADFRIEGMGVSNLHVHLRKGKNTSGEAVFMATDVSQNGTGVLHHGQPEGEAAPMPRGLPILLTDGSGLIIPMRASSGDRAENAPQILWLRHMHQSPGASQEAAPTCPPAPATRPSSWPKSWASLPEHIQQTWIAEGIENASDLRSFYTSRENLHEELEKIGVPRSQRDIAANLWMDTARALATARSSTEPRPRGSIPAPARATDTPLPIRKRQAPKLLHEPGLAHLHWQAKQAEKAARATRAQGLQPASSEHMEEVWQMYLRAGRHTSLYRDVRGPDELVFKDLLLRPIRRYPDSMQARLAAWRRWEAWLLRQPTKLPTSPFKPGDFIMGKYLREVEAGGPTAASNVWAAMKWWATRLGLDLGLDSPLVADYRLKTQGHSTKQADVLTLDIVARLRVEAEGTGTGATFASLILLLAGGCVRFLHAQRSALMEETSDLVVFRCSKGKRRQHGIREGYRWAAPRCWRPAGDTLARAVALIKEVATRAAGYHESPFIIPDITTSQGHSIHPQDCWIPRPMSYAKFVALMRAYIADLRGDEKPQKMTFNALRRLMPTGADVLEFKDTVAAGIGNWQDVPKGSAEKKRGRLKDKMATRYAGEKVITAGNHKMRVVAAIWDVSNDATCQGAGTWSEMTHRYPDAKILHRMTKSFKVDREAPVSVGDLRCLPHLPVGLLRHRQKEHLREIPALSDIAWSMQFVATSIQRPWLHFAPELGTRPYCRTSAFKKDPVQQGLGLKSAAHTGERPCPRCVGRMGPHAQEIMAEFCLDDSNMS